MRDKAEFPPLVVFQDGDTYILGDGFHRHAAPCVSGQPSSNANSGRAACARRAFSQLALTPKGGPPALPGWQ
jgi:hypothetical protein